MKRSEAREQAFILIFEKMFNPELSLDDITALAQECGLFTVDEFSLKLCTSVIGNISEIDEKITALSKDWKLDRLPRVTLAILRLSLAEILYFDDVPDSVSINEAVELAKKYAGEDDAPFINGLLGSAVRAKAGK